MRKIGRTIVLAAALALPAGLQAQDFRYGAHYNAGGVWFSPLNGGASGSASDLTLDPGWIVGLQFEKWLGSGRLGWRLNGAITERPLSLESGSRDIGVWLLDADMLLRMLPADPYRRGNAFISLGIGVLKYGLGSGELLALQDANALYSGNDAPRLVGAAGMGFDLFTGWRWDGDPVGIRFEVVDHIVIDSPFEPLAGNGFSPVHNLRFVIGAFAGWGLLR